MLTLIQYGAILRVSNEGADTLVKMNREQMLDYIKKFDGADLGKTTEYNEKQVLATVKKMEELMKKFGFEYHSSFSARSGSYKDKDTSWFWRYTIGEHEYIEVQTGYYKEGGRTYGRGKNKKTYPGPFRGICRVTHMKVPLNPDTNRPYQIGDTITHPSGCYSVTLTKRGWYSGD